MLSQANLGSVYYVKYSTETKGNGHQGLSTLYLEYGGKKGGGGLHEVRGN